MNLKDNETKSRGFKNDLTHRLLELIKKQRVYVAIDAANLYYAALKAKMHLNFEQIYNWFNKNTKYVELGFYTAYNAEDEKQIEFLERLEEYGYKIIKKPIKIFQNHKVKGNMDIEITVDILKRESEFDVFVLMSGDGDFSYLIKALTKTTIVLGVGGFTSYDLHQMADNYFFLDRVSAVWRSRKNVTELSKTQERYIIFIDQIDYPDEPEEKKLLVLQPARLTTTRTKINTKNPKVKLKVSKQNTSRTKQ